MRFAVSAIAFVAPLALVQAQSVPGIPDCALACLTSGLLLSGCAATEIECQCTTGRDAITKSLNTCVPGACPRIEEAAKVGPALEALCAKAGVTLTTNTGTVTVTSGSTSALTTTTTTPSGNATSTTTKVTNATHTHTNASITETNAPGKTGAAVANAAGWGAIAVGVAAMFGL